MLVKIRNGSQSFCGGSGSSCGGSSSAAGGSGGGGWGGRRVRDRGSGRSSSSRMACKVSPSNIGRQRQRADKATVCERNWFSDIG